MPSRGPDMKEIVRCVVCGRNLDPNRVHVDTCGERCYKRLLERQRTSLEGEATDA